MSVTKACFHSVLPTSPFPCADAAVPGAVANAGMLKTQARAWRGGQVLQRHGSGTPSGMRPEPRLMTVHRRQRQREPAVSSWVVRKPLRGNAVLMARQSCTGEVSAGRGSSRAVGEARVSPDTRWVLEPPTGSSSRPLEPWLPGQKRAAREGFPSRLRDRGEA